MKNWLKRGIIVLFMLLISASVFTGCDDSDVSQSVAPGPQPEPKQVDLLETAMTHTRYLSETIGKRVAGGQGEEEARFYIYDQFLKMGYFNVSVQPFSYTTRAGDEMNSGNVIAVKEGTSDKEVIVGGHYDSVSGGTGTGASDNGASIGAILALAEKFKDQVVPYTIRFIAFGAEEVGLKGSNYFVSQMTEAQIANTIAMLNLDTIVGGDKIYVYGGLNDNGWVRDQALSIAESLGIGLETNPGLNPDYPAGTTGPWSDHVAFEDNQIPIAYFEATNWEIGDLDGYVQTVEYGEIWHTDRDTLEWLESAYPGRVETQLGNFLQVFDILLGNFAPPQEALMTGKRAVPGIVTDRFEPNRGH